MKRMFMLTAVLLCVAAPGYANSAFRVVGQGSEPPLPLRDGPGVNHTLLAQVPIGDYVIAHHCGIARDDGIPGATWCVVRWGAQWGFVSQARILPAE
jgi:hypothetical protein